MLGRTVAELEATMTSRELTEWMAFMRLESRPPDGPPAPAGPGALRADMDEGALRALDAIKRTHRKR